LLASAIASRERPIAAWSRSVWRASLENSII
jgi:hypothetical protein